MDLNNFSFSTAGSWEPIDLSYYQEGYDGGAINFSGKAPVGTNQLPGLVMFAWAHSGFLNQASDTISTRVAMFEQVADGTLKEVTDAYLSDSLINGAGSLVTYDFNNDGYVDYFLAAHNESPFISKKSSVYLSNENGTYNKIEVDNEVMAHDAQLAVIDGVPHVVTSGFSNDLLEQGGTFHNPIFFWEGGGFSSYDMSASNNNWANGSSAIVYDLDGDGDLEYIASDMTFGPGFEGPVDEAVLGIYAYSDGEIGSAPLKKIDAYLSSHPDYLDYPGFLGEGHSSHSYRFWLDDFNYDGQMDIIVPQSFWSETSDDWPNAIQMLQNNGNLEFSDRTDQLNPDFDLNTDEIDYEVVSVDIDNSGINSYLMGKSSSEERNSNYLLLNDGTGRLYVGLNNEFLELGQQVWNYLRDDLGQEYYLEGDRGVPAFHGYLTAEGKLNFAAEASVAKNLGNGVWGEEVFVVNVPLEIDLSTDFTDQITITDRNNSQLIRTFAGDDIIHSTNANSNASIDGGHGRDLAVYSEAFTDAAVTSNGSGGHIVSLPGLIDTLENIERLQFSDTNVALDIEGSNSAGGIYRTYQAAFDRTPDTGGFGYWIDRADNGATAVQMAEEFVWSAEFQSVYNVTTADNYLTGNNIESVVDGFYRNVLGRNPDQGGLDYYIEVIVDQEKTVGRVLAEIADSPENRENLLPTIQNGMEFDLWFG